MADCWASAVFDFVLCRPGTAAKYPDGRVKIADHGIASSDGVVVLLGIVFPVVRLALG